MKDNKTNNTSTFLHASTMLGMFLLLPLAYSWLAFMLEAFMSIFNGNSINFIAHFTPLVVIAFSVTLSHFVNKKHIKCDLERGSYMVIVAGYTYASYYMSFEILQLGNTGYLASIAIPLLISRGSLYFKKEATELNDA